MVQEKYHGSYFVLEDKDLGDIQGSAIFDSLQTSQQAAAHTEAAKQSGAFTKELVETSNKS